MVRRVLKKHYRPEPDGSTGPSWLTAIGHAKDSLWSRDAGPVDLFRCESIRLQTHWVLVVMDQFTRQIIGFGVQVGAVDGHALCRMFNEVISKQGEPTYLSSDNDPLFQYHQWQANLRLLEAEEIKTVPYIPLSHPFIERIIGTVRREFLDHVFSGTPRICSENLMRSKRIATGNVFIPRWVENHRNLLSKIAAQHYKRIDGNAVAAAFMNYRWRRD